MGEEDQGSNRETVQVSDKPLPPDATQHFQVGDIIENTWGYGQTNWYFYRVLKVTKRFLLMHRLQDIRWPRWLPM